MDIFIEKIISKKKGLKEYLLTAGIILISIILAFIVIGTFGLQGPALIIVIGIFIGDWYLITSMNVEYEYSITNGELDIDKIIAQRKRKRIFSASCKDFEILAKISSDKYNESIDTIPTKIKAVTSMDADNILFATVESKGKKVLLYFEPDERMMKVFKSAIPRKVFE